MNYEELFIIVKEMSKINHFGFRAERLFNVINQHINEDDELIKQNLEKRIRELIFNTFMDSIDRKTRKELLNLNIVILEDCYTVEQNNKLWRIDNYGAVKYRLEDDTYIKDEIIPRDHDNGFHLTENSSQDAINYFKKNECMLSTINNLMSRKEEIITNDYNTKKFVPRDFTEKLIDYLGFR